MAPLTCVRSIGNSVGPHGRELLHSGEPALVVVILGAGSHLLSGDADAVVGVRLNVLVHRLH